MKHNWLLNLQVDWKLLIKSFFAAPLMLANCRSCPDLALPAIQFELVNTDESNLAVTFIKQEEKEPLLERVTLEKSSQLPQGRYRMIVYEGDKAVGTIDSICTVGALSGCAAEDAGENSTPQIRIESNDGVISVTLIRNGLCS